MQCNDTKIEYGQFVEKIKELYVVLRKKYLLQSNDGSQYYHMGTDSKFNDKRPLVDTMLVDHLKGKRTIGVFASNVSKFMVFDFDFENDWNECKRHYYAVRQAVIDCGIPPDCIYATFSGSKGIHLEIFFDQPVPVPVLKRFYLYVLGEAGFIDLQSKIEFRPTDRQGVKLPLGKHQKTKRWCPFIDPLDVETHFPRDYILNVEPMDTELFLDDVIAAMNDDYLDDPNTGSSTKIRKADAYSLFDKSLDDDFYENLFEKGLTVKGTRHQSTFQLAVYFKSKLGLGQSEVRDLMVEWIERQPQSMMDTPKDKAVELTLELVRKVFYYDYSLGSSAIEINVTKSELEFILSAKNSSGKLLTPKQKFVLFALLGHSKRFAGKTGIFYMTYEQITALTGMQNRTEMRKLIDEFENVGYITIHRRNAKQSGTFKKLPNMYQVNFAENGKTAECATNTNDGIVLTDYDAESLRHSLDSLFTKHELKSILPRRQFQTICG